MQLNQRTSVHLAVGLSGAGLYHVEGLGPDEAVTGQPLSPLHTLQEEGVRRLSYLQVGGNGGLQGRVELTVQTDQGARPGHAFDLF